MHLGTDGIQAGDLEESSSWWRELLVHLISRRGHEQNIQVRSSKSRRRDPTGRHLNLHVDTTALRLYTNDTRPSPRTHVQESLTVNSHAIRNEFRLLAIHTEVDHLSLVGDRSCLWVVVELLHVQLTGVDVVHLVRRVVPGQSVGHTDLALQPVETVARLLVLVQAAIGRIEDVSALLQTHRARVQSTITVALAVVEAIRPELLALLHLANDSHDLCGVGTTVPGDHSDATTNADGKLVLGSVHGDDEGEEGFVFWKWGKI